MLLKSSKENVPRRRERMSDVTHCPEVKWGLPVDFLQR